MGHWTAAASISPYKNKIIADHRTVGGNTQDFDGQGFQVAPPAR